MAIHNVRCLNEECPAYEVVEEVLKLSHQDPNPACLECSQERSITYIPTSEQDRKYWARALTRRTKVRDPSIKPNTVLRRAFDPKSTPQDLADDLRTGDIFL